MLFDVISPAGNILSDINHLSAGNGGMDAAYLRRIKNRLVSAGKRNCLLRNFFRRRGS